MQAVLEVAGVWIQKDGQIIIHKITQNNNHSIQKLPLIKPQLIEKVLKMNLLIKMTTKIAPWEYFNNRIKVCDLELVKEIVIRKSQLMKIIILQFQSMNLNLTQKLIPKM